MPAFLFANASIISIVWSLLVLSVKFVIGGCTFGNAATKVGAKLRLIDNSFALENEYIDMFVCVCVHTMEHRIFLQGNVELLTSCQWF